MALGTTVLAAVGRALAVHDLDVEGADLRPRGTLDLPEGLQYLWPLADRRRFIAACSDGRPGFKGTRHCACTLAMSATGEVTVVGEPIPLPSRPVHISADRESRYALITYPAPSRIAVHPIGADGRLGEEIAQEGLPALAKTAHQALFTPDGRRVVLPIRGNPAEHGNPEDPGSLAIFDFRDGKLSHAQTLAPDGGYGFGPRHVDFHPSQPWMYMSIERQNQVALFRMGERFEGPLHRTTTLERPEAEKPRQLVGAIHVHPKGHVVYVSNRADGTLDHQGRKVFNGGENSIAAYAVDPQTGKPTPLQKANTNGMHPRTFHVDPTGRILVAANMTNRDVLEAGVVKHVPGGLSVFRIADDGRLDFVRKLDADTTKDHQFWVGMVGAP